MNKCKLLYILANRKMKEYDNLEMAQEYALYHNLGVYYCAEGHALRGLKNQLDFCFGKYLLLQSQKLNPSYINYTFLGHISYQKKKYKSAIKYYQKASNIMLTWECEYNLALSFYKDNQIQCAFQKIKRLYDMIHSESIFLDNYIKEDAFYLIDSFYFLLLAENKISPFEFVDESFVFKNCSLDCGLYIGYFLNNYEITHRYLQILFCKNPRIYFEKNDYALIVDCLLQTNDNKLLHKFLLYNADDKHLIRMLNKLIANKIYRKKRLAHIQLNPEPAEIIEQYIFKNL